MTIINEAKQTMTKALSEISNTDKAALTAVMYNLMFLNDLAVTTIHEAMYSIEGLELDKHAVKKWMKRCRIEIRNYNMQLDIRTGNYIEFLADLNNKYETEWKEDLWKLKNAVIFALYKAKINNDIAELITDMYVASVFICGTNHNNDHCMDSFPHLWRWKCRYEWMKLSRLEEAYMKLVDAVKKKVKLPDYESMLDGNQSINIGYRVIANKLQNADRILTICNNYAEKWDAKHPEYFND